MKLWGGRFSREQSKKFLDFESSIKFDFRLAPYDIAVNRAWAKMLNRIEIISDKELKRLLAAFEDVEKDFEKGRLKETSEFEDIHTLIEDSLFTYAGAVARKLPAGRSRNELVSADVRLYMRDKIDYLLGEVKGLQRRFLASATRYSRVVMPGFTHLQPAVPITIGHLVLSYFWKFERDKKFLKYVREETNVMPLGGGACGGSTIPVDTDFLMTELSFPKAFENSVDGTSSRDFILLFLEACSNMQIHLSGICEDIILFSTTAFGFIRLSDEFSTGSSLMPQKKNPDFFELVRGKSGRIIGNLNAMMIMLKGIPSGYSRDLQEDKGSLFDSVDEITEIFKVFPAVFSSLEFDAKKMSDSMASGGVCAQALAEHLVLQGVPFRTAHEIVGKIVRDNERMNREMSGLKLTELKAYCEFFAGDVIPLLTAEGVINQLATPGSPSPLKFEEQLRTAYEAVEE